MTPPWGFVVASAAVAISAAQQAYRLAAGPEPYSQFLSGTLAWSAASKRQDFALLLTLVVGFLLVVHLLVSISRRLRHRFGVGAASEFHVLTIYASLPLALWAGTTLFTERRSLELTYAAAALVAAVMSFSSWAALRRWRGADRLSVSVIVGGSLLVVLFAAASGVGFAAGLHRLGILAGLDVLAAHPVRVRAIIVAATGLALLGVAVVWAARGLDERTLRRRLGTGLLAAQGLTPWLFVSLLPAPWTDGARVFYGRPLAATAALAGVLIAAAYVDLGRRVRRDGSIWSRVSPLCLMAILIYLKMPIARTPSISDDDYHFGEALTPWWSWHVHHLVPFWDFVPARGLVNYAPGFLASVFFDGTAASVAAVWPLLSACYLLIAFPVIAASIGRLSAFVALLLMPTANLRSEVDLLVTVALCVLARGFDRWSFSRWLGAWVVVGGAGLLVAPAQGGALALATSPLAVVALARAWRSEASRLRWTLIAVSIVAGLLGALTPVGRMVLGAVRYVVEQGSINRISYGIPWSLSAGAPFASPFAWEAARASWVAVAAVAGLLILQSRRAPARQRHAVFVYALPIFLLCLLSIPRVAGRIDPSGISRLGFHSIWMLTLLLPIVLLTWSRGRERPGVLFAAVVAAAVLAPFALPRGGEEALSRVTETVAAPPPAAIQGAAIGLPNIGTAVMTPAHVERLETIRAWLGRLLEPHETYLDLTNRNAHYFYFDRRPPTETAAVYNLVHDRQQQRALRALIATPLPSCSPARTISPGTAARRRCGPI